MNRGLAALVAALAMMDPDDVPPLLTRAERCADRVQRDDGSAERKRARRAARRLREQETTAAGRAR